MCNTETTTNKLNTQLCLLASLIPTPERYEEPKNWTTDSALRLMCLIKENKAATALQQTLKKVLASSVASNSSGVRDVLSLHLLFDL